MEVSVTPNDILTTKPIDRGSAWHVNQAKAWLNYAIVNTNPLALHYCAFELRYGLEYFLFELLVLTKKEISEADYKKCLSNPDKITKMLQNRERPYQKLCEFTEAAHKVTPIPAPVEFWKLQTVVEYIGRASEYLHFSGTHSKSHSKKDWFEQASSKLQNMVNIFHGNLTVGLLNPDSMPEPVFNIWTDYLNDKISLVNVENRLRLIEPMLRSRIFK